MKVNIFLGEINKLQEATIHQPIKCIKVANTFSNYTNKKDNQSEEQFH